MSDFSVNIQDFSTILYVKGTEKERSRSDPFCGPLILRHPFLPRFFLISEASVPASFLDIRNTFRNAFFL